MIWVIVSLSIAWAAFVALRLRRQDAELEKWILQLGDRDRAEGETFASLSATLDEFDSALAASVEKLEAASRGLSNHADGEAGSSGRGGGGETEGGHDGDSDHVNVLWSPYRRDDRTSAEDRTSRLNQLWSSYEGGLLDVVAASLPEVHKQAGALTSLVTWESGGFSADASYEDFDFQSLGSEASIYLIEVKAPSAHVVEDALLHSHHEDFLLFDPKPVKGRLTYPSMGTLLRCLWESKPERAPAVPGFTAASVKPDSALRPA